MLANADSTASLDLRWDAPGRNGGPAIAGYQVQYRAGTDCPWSDHEHKGADTRATVAELESATQYQARVRALNGEMPGDWSEPGAGNTGTADNEAPVFDSGLPAAVTVNENTGADSDIGAPFTATDPDGDTLTYTWPSRPARVRSSASGAWKHGTMTLTGSVGVNDAASGTSTPRQSLYRTAAGLGGRTSAFTVVPGGAVRWFLAERRPSRQPVDRGLPRIGRGQHWAGGERPRDATTSTRTTRTV